MPTSSQKINQDFFNPQEVNPKEVDPQEVVNQEVERLPSSKLFINSKDNERQMFAGKMLGRF